MKLQEHPQALRSALCYIPTGTHAFLPGESLGEARAEQRARKQCSSSFPDSPIRPHLCGASRALFLEEEQRGGGRTGSTALVPAHAELQPLSFQMRSFSDLLAFHFFPWKLTPCPALGPDTQAALSYLPPAGHSSTWKFFP